jgi:Peptidase_C39 like family
MSTQQPHANQRHAIAELSLLLLTRSLPPGLEGARIEPHGTVIHDLNGQPLFRRLALTGAGVSGYADVAVAPELGAPLVAVSHGQAWDEHALLTEGKRVAVNRFKMADAAQVQFVAYSFPKIALRFLDRDHRELLLLELWTWEQVPERRQDRKPEEPPGNFERWSYLDETPREILRVKAENHDRRQAALGRLAERVQSFTLLDRISSSELEVVLALYPGSLLGDSRDLHYGTHAADHVPCYELHGQETSVWCVAASVQMVLDFYRYEYTQVRLAQEMGLGTLAHPKGLPYGQEHKVVDTLQKLTGDALTAHLNTSPNWGEFRSEILANRPLISFIPGHSRTVAGYTESGILNIIEELTPFRGLLVYDPWPPNMGVVTRYENFDAQTYRDTFTAHVTLQ